jgi:hypothetical protein
MPWITMPRKPTGAYAKALNGVGSPARVKAKGGFVLSEGAPDRLSEIHREPLPNLGIERNFPPERMRRIIVGPR